MGLVINGTILSVVRARLLGGGPHKDAGLPGYTDRRNADVGGISKFSALPEGYRPPYCWRVATKTGGLGCTGNRMLGTGASSGNLAGGLNAESSLAGSSSIAADLGLVAKIQALLSGTGVLTADAAGKLEASAALSGSGAVSAALGALAGLAVEMQGAGAISAAARADAFMSCHIAPATDLEAEQIAAAVVDALGETEIPVDIKKINSVTVTGAGVTGDSWRPA